MRKTGQKRQVRKKFRLRIPSNEEFLAHPVDAFLGSVMGIREVFVPFLRFALSENLAKDIDFDSLWLDNTVYRTSRNLHKRIPDIVYRGNFISSGRPLIIRIIQEFKDNLTEGRLNVELQMLGYVVLSMQADEKQNGEEFAAPICILLYRRATNWSKGSLLRRYEGAPKWATDCLPRFQYFAVGTDDLNDETIENLGGFIQRILFALKYSRDDKNLLDNFDKIFNFASTEELRDIADHIFHAIFKFIASMSTHPIHVLEDRLDSLPYETKNERHTALQQIMDRRERWKNEGIAEGEVLGIAKGKAEGEVLGIAKGKAEGEVLGIAKGKVEVQVNAALNLLSKFSYLSDSEIADLLGCSPSLVTELRKK